MGSYPIAALVRTGKGHRIRNPGDRGEEATFLRRSGRIGPSGAGGIDGPGFAGKYVTASRLLHGNRPRLSLSMTGAASVKPWT